MHCASTAVKKGSEGWSATYGMGRGAGNDCRSKIVSSEFHYCFMVSKQFIRAEWRVTVPIEPLNLYLAATPMRSQRARPSKDDLMWSRVVNYLSVRKFWRNVFIKSWNKNNWRTILTSHLGVCRDISSTFIDRCGSIAQRAFFPSSTSRDIDGKAKPCNLNLRPQDRDPIKSHNMSSSIIRWV